MRPLEFEYCDNSNGTAGMIATRRALHALWVFGPGKRRPRLLRIEIADPPRPVHVHNLGAYLLQTGFGVDPIRDREGTERERLVGMRYMYMSSGGI